MRDLPCFELRREGNVEILTLQAVDGTNRLTKNLLLELQAVIEKLAAEKHPLIITGSKSFFSVGADLREISALRAASANKFAGLGQALMNVVETFPVPVFAAVSGFCMGGGFDLALACHRRVAAPNAVFAHRGAALGLMTGWGGTQRLPRIVGRGRAMELLITAEQVSAQEALSMGLVEGVSDTPVEEALARLR